MARSIYALYEKSVQSPERHVAWFDDVYLGLRGFPARSLREDFCGTHLLATQWVSLRPGNVALGLDLDAETLEHGKARNRKKLKPSLRERVIVSQADVMNVTQPGVDLLVACNFSFFIFKQRQQLAKYFRAVHGSLAKDGLAIFEMAGGPGMIEPVRERKVFKRGGKWDFTYIWDQKSFDPITHDAKYAIHFNLADGTRIQDAFTYDWRLWTIPEVKDLLAECGFKEIRVYWETSHDGEGTGEYVETQSADNAWAWIAYVVAGR